MLRALQIVVPVLLSDQGVVGLLEADAAEGVIACLELEYVLREVEYFLILSPILHLLDFYSIVANLTHQNFFLAFAGTPCPLL